MTIEKKFRAWDKIRKIMTEPFGLKDFDGDYFIPDGVMLNDENSEIMQYTGLPDKNGKEICEGDILKWTHPDFKEFKKEYKILEMSDIRKSLMLEMDCQNGYIEVIGNIYQNKDLLK